VNDQWGLLMLGIAAAMNLVGFLWIRKIVTFEI
jgi:Flp pilus assembly protein TadB